MSRVFDFFCALAGLVLLLPVFFFIALAVKLSDGGPILYRQQRAGKDFQPFWLLKFRTMVVGADRSGLLTAQRDSRVTRIGGFLRKYKLDELPQLFNVLTGSMQFVGPRPEVPKYVERFRREYASLLSEPPGITDPASIAFRAEETLLTSSYVEEQYIAEILPQKLKLSMEYQNRRGFWSDLRIIWQTLVGVA